MRTFNAVIALAALIGGLAGAADSAKPVTIEAEIISYGYPGGSGGFVSDGAIEDEGAAYLGQWSIGMWGWGWSAIYDLTLVGSDGTISLTLENGSWEIYAGTGDHAGLKGSGTYTVSRELLSATGGWWGLPIYVETYVLEGSIEG